MKCTDKEQETCRVEKMGCKGCHYDYISKEEIREVLKEYEKKEMTVENVWDFYKKIERLVEV